MAPKYVKIVGKNHSKCMTDYIQNCWDTEFHSNVMFTCKDFGSVGKTLCANKAVLAAASPKFHLLLTDTGNDEENVNIIVPGNDFHIVKMLLQYIYTGEVLVSSFLDELEGLILDWEIGYPQVIPVAAESVATRKSTFIASSSSNPLHPIAEERRESSSDENYFQAADWAPSDERQSPEPLKQNKSSKKGVRNRKTRSKSNEKTAVEDARETLGTDDASKEVDIHVDPVGIDHEYAVQKKKRIRRTIESPQPNEEVLSIEETEEDKADLLLSQVFLKKEKSRSPHLIATIIEMKRAVKRHQLYMKHFFGVSPRSLPSTREKIKKVVKVVVRIPCKICGKDVHPDYMKSHIATIHSNERPYLCEHCGVAFAMKCTLRTHVKRLHTILPPAPTHTCTICSKIFKTKIYLRNHMTLHTGEKPYQCPYCDKSFRKSNVLVKHKRTHTGEKPFGPCDVCGRCFSVRDTFVAHLRIHGQSKLAGTGYAQWIDPETKLLKCDTCGLTFHRENAFLSHVAYHKGEEPKLPCPQCSDTFPSFKLLNEHGRIQHPESFFPCQHCTRSFRKKYMLNQHMLLHTVPASEKVPCEECGKEFVSLSKLKMHIYVVHSTKQLLKCRFCPKQFKEKHFLVNHERIHTGERPFGCSLCSKFFRLKIHLENHLRVHSGEKPFKCSECGKAFGNKTNLYVHMKLHRGEKIQCPICGEIFRSYVKLEFHEQTEHNDDDEEGDVASDNCSQEDDED